ncbi:CYSTEINE-RICH REPEAT SECRETORY PROTEIN [Salix viminalis]|uniref:CYSTEINE-RICH REPEAT SECRETORY PROTEIN n=1 Tax=Salix viminalis TaxID=40686 RepID=A0A9Q0QHS1_SALVM|nr:CYSTEINE-RICH REPEAT SECRETORY PROTEIN [Salix viminalis]
MDYFLIWLSVSYSVILYSPLIAAQQFEYRSHICTNDSTYTANSSYPSNLNATLSSLYENASRSDDFGSISVGQNSDRVSALFLCRGDNSSESCRGCIKTAREEIKIRCSNYKEAIIWYDRCMLRYSNRSIFSLRDEWPRAWLGNKNDIGNDIDQNQFNSNLVGLMFQLISRASICLSGRVSEIPSYCSGKLGCNVLTPSCSMRFETYPFYTAPPPPASSPSPTTPPPTSLNPSGERKASSRTILYISVPTSAFVVLFFSICYYCYVHKKAKKENSAMKGGNGIENMERNLSNI